MGLSSGPFRKRGVGECHEEVRPDRGTSRRVQVKVQFQEQGLGLVEALRLRKKGSAYPAAECAGAIVPGGSFSRRAFRGRLFFHTEHQGAQAHYPQPDVVINKREVVVLKRLR